MKLSHRGPVSHRAAPRLGRDARRLRRPAVFWWFALVIVMALPTTTRSTDSSPGSPHVSSQLAAQDKFDLLPTVAFVSTAPLTGTPFEAAEIYLVNEEGSTSVRRITENEHYDAFPAISPDGKKILFDSDAPVEGRPPSVYYNPDLWVMSSDGTERTYLDHGASGTWSRDSKYVAYHASASGAGAAIRLDPSAATIDSDIFILNVDDVLAGVAQRMNLTNSPNVVDEDPDWSPVADVIVYTSHSAASNQVNPADAEIYVRNADGSGEVTPLTDNSREERAPAWSPDGTKIVYMCREVFDDATQRPIVVGPDFEVCVMNADGSGQRALTNNTVPDLGPNWSTDGTRIFLVRPRCGRTTAACTCSCL
jgi:Tol biopolymer transport system component